MTQRQWPLSWHLACDKAPHRRRSILWVLSYASPSHMLPWRSPRTEHRHTMRIEAKTRCAASKQPAVRLPRARGRSGTARATTTASWAKGPAWRRGQCRVAQGMDVCTRDPPIGRGRFDLSQIALAVAACLHGVACMHPHRIPRSVPLIRAGARGARVDGMALPAVAHVHTGSRSRSHVQGAKRHALETHAAHRRLPAPQCPPQHSESAIPIQKRGGVNNMRHCSLLVRSDAATGIR